MAHPGFRGHRVALFESRMADAMAQSIRSHGGEPVAAPSMREVPLDSNRDVFLFAEHLFGGRLDVLICTTGVGTRLLLQTLQTRYQLDALRAALKPVTIVARGPKPVRVLNEHQIPITITVPEPNTWRDIVQALDTHDRSLSLHDRLVAVQEYGVSNKSLMLALKQRGAHVLPVPVYQWALPEDIGPLAQAIRELIDGRVSIALFTNAMQIRHAAEVAAAQGLDGAFRDSMKRVVIGSVGPTTTDALLDAGFHVDFEPSHPKMGPLITELAPEAERLVRERREGRPSPVTRRASPGPDTRALRAESLFLKACRREPTPVTPVWLMRQAGRYMKEYRELRNRVGFLELCKNKELVAEITVMAVEKLRVDAAIIFSDLLVVVEPMGLSLEYHAGDGPVISGQAETGLDVDRLREIDARELQYVFDAIRLTRSALEPTMPLIGFAGAPFTLASYIIEGGSSQSFLETKRLMYANSGAWHALMEKISRGLIAYLNGQIDAGADAVQLFDSWVGCLGPEAYRDYVLPHTQRVIRALRPGVPVIHFGTGTGPFLPLIREAGGDVIGVDFRIGLGDAWKAIGHDRAIQGNLDPAALYAPPAEIRARVQRVLDQAGARPGHIFNLGHGVLPTTPFEHAVALVDAVHELSRR